MQKKKLSQKLLDSRQFLFQTCEIGQNVCDALTIIFGKRLMPLNVAHAALKISNLLLKAVNAMDYSTNIAAEWEIIDSNIMMLVFDCIQNYPKRTVFFNEYLAYVKYEVESIEFLVGTNSNRTKPISIYYPKGKKEEASRYLRIAAAAKYSSLMRLSVMGSNRSFGVHFELHQDEEILGYQPQQFTELYNYTDAFLRKNKSRAICFYGPPGTGKTTISKMLAQKLNLKTLIIPIEELKTISYNNMSSLVDILAPEIVILDDFDKSRHNSSILAILELFKNKSKLVLASANNVNYIKKKKHLARPGRFDRFVEIDQIDPRVVMDLLKSENAEFFEDVKAWPAAFIAEFRDIIEVLGKEQAKESLPELAERVAENRKCVDHPDEEDEDDEDDDVKDLLDDLLVTAHR